MESGRRPSAQTRVTEAALCLTAHCMILVQAAGVTAGGVGLPGARSVTAHDSWVFGEWCAGAMRAGALFAQGGGRDAVPVYCPESFRAANFYYSLGVIADFGDDAGSGAQIQDLHTDRDSDARRVIAKKLPTVLRTSFPL